MELGDLLAKARDQILIMGTTPIGEELPRHAKALAQILKERPSLKLTILYESDDELFKQSICVDRPAEPGLYADLRESRDYLQGIKRRILRSALLSEDSELERQIELRQVHLRLPLNIVKVDSEIWAGVVTTSIGDWSDYTEIKLDHPWRQAIEDYADSYTDPSRMGYYLYDPENDKKLLQICDSGHPPRPRGIFPRKILYPNRDIKKRSVWGFIFNRKGKLLLQKRSKWVVDNLELWDKSFGGHLDAEEEPATMAKKELIQECFLPAEETEYIGEDTSLIINLGEWITPVGEEGAHFTDHLAKAYSHLPKHAWCLFAPNLNGEGNRIALDSGRILPESTEDVLPVPVGFVVDVFFVVAPRDLIDSQKQANENLRHGQQGNAAAAHRLITVRGLMRELQAESGKRRFTRDLHFMADRYQDLLIRFSKTVARMYS